MQTVTVNNVSDTPPTSFYRGILAGTLIGVSSAVLVGALAIALIMVGDSHSQEEKVLSCYHYCYTPFMHNCFPTYTGCRAAPCGLKDVCPDCRY